MNVGSYILENGAVGPSVNLAELAAIKTIVQVLATVIAKGQEHAGGLSAPSYLGALEVFCVEALINADLERSGDLGAHAFRLAVIKQVNAILYGTNLARDPELN